MYLSLIQRFDRITRFIYHSDHYLTLSYQPRSIAKLSSKLEGYLEDKIIDESEIIRIELIFSELNKLIEELSTIDDDGSIEVAYKISVDEINSHIESFAKALN